MSVLINFLPVMDISFSMRRFELFSEEIMSRHPTQGHINKKQNNSDKLGSHRHTIGNENSTTQVVQKIVGK